MCCYLCLHRWSMAHAFWTFTQDEQQWRRALSPSCKTLSLSNRFFECNSFDFFFPSFTRLLKIISATYTLIVTCIGSPYKSMNSVHKARSGFSAGQSSSFTPHTLIHVLVDPALCIDLVVWASILDKVYIKAEVWGLILYSLQFSLFVWCQQNECQGTSHCRFNTRFTILRKFA